MPAQSGTEKSVPESIPAKTPRTQIAKKPNHLPKPNDSDTTDYELSQSTIFPKSKSGQQLPPIIKQSKLPKTQEQPLDSTAPFFQKNSQSLDKETLNLFHQRLRLCCILGTVPFAFYFVCALSNFIEPFGKNVVGIPGAMLAAIILLGLISTAGLMMRPRPFENNGLRALETAVFGSMGLFFAYWQFVVITSAPSTGFTDTEHQRVYVLAITLVTHLNWIALIVFHGVLVPNTLIRGIGVISAMVFVALLIDFFSIFFSSHTRNSAAIVFAIGVPLLLATSVLAIFGTAKTAALREQVEEAKQMLREMGQYRLRKRLGAGGMGEVYLAEHQLLKRPCALKRIHPKYLNNQDQIKRFEREVQATAKLRHPNTVEIYDYGQADDGTFFYVMEYLPGISLEDFVNRYGPMPADRLIYVLKQVCNALREAHRHDLIHRDIKPSNIILLNSGTPYDQIKLVDFGLVHSASWADEQDTKLTRDGLIVGTPEYMSPEQAQGLALDNRSDIFSVGSVAYFMLTGNEPFHRETAMKTLLSVVSDEPRPINENNPFIPEDLIQVVMSCMEKDREKRTASAQHFEIKLEKCKLFQSWTEEKAVKWWEENPVAEPGTGTDLASLPLRGSEDIPNI